LTCLRKLESLQQELTIESAYFVVAERGVEAIKKLRERGIKVRILMGLLEWTVMVPAVSAKTFCGLNRCAG
jgi:phosphatidylserine/phosphatidylglycerophosphate/cardiolipin synthase-like enzyme